MWMGGAGILLGIWSNPAGAVQISASACRLYDDFIGKLLRLINNEYISQKLIGFVYNALSVLSLL